METCQGVHETGWEASGKRQGLVKITGNPDLTPNTGLAPSAGGLGGACGASHVQIEVL